uniref:Enoyl reductase n=1 Tax=Streptoalloteichus sp. ATCC 53650 TaxID=756733 RepID=K4PC66_9PSEU|nr:enoyl reductase [Streptoalloteichus sp. ATCC 53650]
MSTTTGENMSGTELVGVVGAGVIGTGVAQAVAAAGYGVVLVDRTEEVLDTARRGVRDGLRMRRLLGSGGSREEDARTLDRIAFTTDPAELAPVDFVIENVTEDWDVKKSVYRVLDEVCRPDRVLAANTSVIPITGIAGLVREPGRVLGMHFMNPVPLKAVVEVVRGHYTTDATVGTALDLLARMGAEGVVVGDSPGFVTNRVLMPTINEAVFLLQERVAGVEEIDRIFKGCFHHRMGPLETADLIGLDTVLRSIEGLFHSFADSKYRPCPLLRSMVDAGLLGRKSGQGFYSYRGDVAR